MTKETTQKIEELKESLDEAQLATKEQHDSFMFGLRLATATQIMQGLLAAGEKPGEPLLKKSVEMADRLIELCRS